MFPWKLDVLVTVSKLDLKTTSSTHLPTMDFDQQVFITCPYDVVLKHIKYERIGSLTGGSPAIKVIKLKY